MPRPFDVKEIQKQTAAIKAQEAELKAAAAAAGLPVKEYLEAERKALEALKERDAASKKFFEDLKAEQDEIDAKDAANKKKSEARQKAADKAKSDAAKDQAKRDEDAETKRKDAIDARKARMQSFISLARSASAIPGVGTATDVASRALEAHAEARKAGASHFGAAVRGGSAAAVVAGQKGIEATVHGSQIADPAVWERLNYQLDRTQAILGRNLSPALLTLEQKFKKIGDNLGGEGAQLNAPKVGDFASIRERLQVEVLRGLDGEKKEQSKLQKVLKSETLINTLSPILPIVQKGSKDPQGLLNDASPIARLLDGISKLTKGKEASEKSGTLENAIDVVSPAQWLFRSIMDATK